MTKTEQD